MRTIRWMSLLAIAAAGCTKSTSAEDDWTYILSVAPWIRTMVDHCDAYKSTKNRAEKIDLFNQAINSLTTVTVKNTQGEVVELMPIGSPDDPDQYALIVKVRDRVNFMSQSKERSIPRGGDIYLAASKLKADQCVIFSGEKIAAAGSYELGKLCDTRYYMNFTALAPCL
ncbi:MAG: hypothetical protein V3T05_12970 [Myxococcota bacterium]